MSDQLNLTCLDDASLLEGIRKIILDKRSAMNGTENYLQRVNRLNERSISRIEDALRLDRYCMEYLEHAANRLSVPKKILGVLEQGRELLKAEDIGSTFRFSVELCKTKSGLAIIYITDPELIEWK